MKKTCASLALVMVLAACGAETEKTETVTILTHDSFGITEEQIAVFEEETGYELITIAPGDGGVLVNQLILNKDNPQADGVYGLDTFIVGTVLEEDLLDPYTSGNLPDSATDLVVDESLTPIDQGEVCINVDTAWFEENGIAEPETLEDLREPQYAELLALIDPVSSSPGFAFLAATVAEYGDDWEEYWTDLFAGGAHRKRLVGCLLRGLLRSGRKRSLSAGAVLLVKPGRGPRHGLPAKHLRPTGRIRRGGIQCREPRGGAGLYRLHADRGCSGQYPEHHVHVPG